MSCPFKDILGKPKEGAHSARFGGIAVVDTLMTLLLAIIISHNYNQSLLGVFAALFILGEVLHWVFCVDTAVIRAITG